MPNFESPELGALLERVALAPLNDRAFLRVTGEDSTRWLNGMVTNSAQALAEGEGNYNFLLNAQGRIQGDCTLWRDGAEFLLETTKAQAAPIQQHLDKFIIMDDVELMPVMDDQVGLLVAGPMAGPALRSVPLPVQGHLAHGMQNGQPVLVLATSGAVPAYEIWSTAEVIALVRVALKEATVAAVSEETLEAFRVLCGIPRFGQDIRERDLPQETEQTHALHFSKGCYLGQEIVERIRSRGQVHRGFAAFTLEGELPSVPVPLTLDGKPAGEITSVAEIALDTGTALLALGYARRETHGQPLQYEGGIATRREAYAPPGMTS